MNYEMLLSESDSVGLIVKEKPLRYNDGRIKGKKVAIRKDIKTTTEKACVLAEELGHYHTSSGNILNQIDIQNRKQEYRARMWAYNRLIGLNSIIDCYKANCKTLYEMANYLDVTEEFLKDALESFKKKYGLFKKVDNYVIYFEPSLSVFELI